MQHVHREQEPIRGTASVFPYDTAHHLFGEAGFENMSPESGETYILRLLDPLGGTEYLYIIPAEAAGGWLTVSWEQAAFQPAAGSPPEEPVREAHARAQHLKSRLSSLQL